MNTTPTDVVLALRELLDASENVVIDAEDGNDDADLVRLWDAQEQARKVLEPFWVPSGNGWQTFTPP